MAGLLETVRMLPRRWQMRRLKEQVRRTVSLEAASAALDDAALVTTSLALRYRAKCGQPLDELLPEAFALVREAARRTIGLKHFESQLLGGAALHAGAIAEMQTGEGKTLTATLPLYLHALGGKGAHLATANDYLAGRDAEWMQPVYRALGLSVASVVAGTQPTERNAAYRCDITYGTAREFAFDFLRDRLKQRQRAEAQGLLYGGKSDPSGAQSHQELVQRGLNFVVIDEADSLLIDEARIPLIISARSSDDGAETAAFLWSTQAVGQFREVEHFTHDRARKQIELTLAGRQLTRTLPKPPQIDRLQMPQLYEFIERAIRVQREFLRDRHYIVRDNKVLIVDEFTGRVAEGRQWRDGLHQAVEAREGLDVSIAAASAARITIQEFFALYQGLAGMTGTAQGSTREFRGVYHLDVVTIPTNRPCLRQRLPDRILPTAAAKWRAVVAEVREIHATGRPVLIGTRSIDKSEELSAELTSAGIEHAVLHARHLADEAAIVAHAGERGRVTVATNMAGRGTDIRLAPGIAELGGLYIVGTELHDSSRIDWQLYGRCARQGDPGSCRQLVSLDDEILDLGLGAERAERIRRSWQAASVAGAADESQLPLDRLNGLFHRAQRNVERRHYGDRRMLMQQAERRRKLHESLGQDPYLDSVDGNA